MISKVIIVLALLQVNLGDTTTIKSRQTEYPIQKSSDNCTLQDTIDRVRRSAVRATLAEKLDPNFWPTRGRRSQLKDKDLYHRLQWLRTQSKFTNDKNRIAFSLQNNEDDDRYFRETSAETGPFWANRGRSLNNNDEEVFWAGRGRSIDDLHQSLEASSKPDNRLTNEQYNNNWYQYIVDNPNLERALTSAEEPFWANRGRSIDEEPFWANRGRSTDEEPFWANRGRALNSGEEGPFWANRGKREESGNEKEETKRGGRWRRQPLYVEEPRWILLARRESSSSDASHKKENYVERREEPYEIDPRDDPFWVARGKKKKREAQKYPINKYFWPSIGKKDTQNVVRALNKINQDHFWPVRGKRPREGENK